MKISDLIQKLSKISSDYSEFDEEELEVVICVRQMLLDSSGIVMSQVLALVEKVEVDDDCDKVVIEGLEL